jgi:hypothetical protein
MQGAVLKPTDNLVVHAGRAPASAVITIANGANGASVADTV